MPTVDVDVVWGGGGGRGSQTPVDPSGTGENPCKFICIRIDSAAPCQVLLGAGLLLAWIPEGSGMNLAGSPDGTPARGQDQPDPPCCGLLICKLWRVLGAPALCCHGWRVDPQGVLCCCLLYGPLSRVLWRKVLSSVTLAGWGCRVHAGGLSRGPWRAVWEASPGRLWGVWEDVGGEGKQRGST